MSETKIDLDAIRQAIEERDAALQAADDLANEMVYRGNSVSWWWSKANAYRDAIEKCWNEVQKGGLRADGDTPVWESIRKIVAERDALRAEAERLRARIEGAPITELHWLDTSWATHPFSHELQRLIGKRVRLVVDEGEGA